VVLNVRRKSSRVSGFNIGIKGPPRVTKFVVPVKVFEGEMET
jgi:hypothetical protein